MTDRDLAFLSYASEDVDKVRKVYAGLKERGLNVWFDRVSLNRPGSWYDHIMRAIAKSRYFIFCLSPASLKKTSLDRPGFVDSELQRATEFALKQASDRLEIVPVRLEECDRGDHRLSTRQQFDLFHDFEAELDKLAVALGGRSKQDPPRHDPRSDLDKLVDKIVGKATLTYYYGDYPMALGLLDTVLEYGEGRDQIWHLQGLALYQSGQVAAALEAISRANQISPDYDEYLYDQALILEELGQIHKAIAKYKDLIESLKKQIERAEGEYYDEVDHWSSTAEFDAMFGTPSTHMSDYYDNEVLASHIHYRRVVRDGPGEIKGLEKRKGQMEARKRELEEMLKKGRA